MQSFVWFVSVCRIWTGAILRALEKEPEQIMLSAQGEATIGRTYLAGRSPKMTSKDCGNRARGLDPFILPLTQFNIHTSTCTSQNPNSLSLTYPGNLWCPHKDLFKGTDTFGVMPWKESLPWRKKNSASINEIILQTVRWCGRVVMMAPSPKFFSPHRMQTMGHYIVNFLWSCYIFKFLMSYER